MYSWYVIFISVIPAFNVIVCLICFCTFELLSSDYSCWDWAVGTTDLRITEDEIGDDGKGRSEMHRHTACVAGEVTIGRSAASTLHIELCRLLWLVLTSQWQTQRSLCNALSTLVWQWLYTSALEHRYLFLEEWPPWGSIGCEDLKLVRLQIAGCDVWLQCVLVSLQLSTLGLSSMLNLNVKDYFDDTSVVHPCDVTNPTELSWHQYRLNFCHVADMQDFSFRDLVLQSYTSDEA